MRVWNAPIKVSLGKRHREPIPLRPSLPSKLVRSFFLFFQFFRQTRAEKLTTQAISGQSGKFSNRLWGHD